MALRGLEQLASFLISPPRPLQPDRPTFVGMLLETTVTLLQALQQPQTSMEEIFMGAGVISRLAANQHVKLLMGLPTWPQFLQQLGLFTEQCSQRLLALFNNRQLSSDEAAELELSPQMASFASVLHAWAIFAKYAVYRSATDQADRQDHPPAKGSAMQALRESLGLVYRLFVHVRLEVCDHCSAFPRSSRIVLNLPGSSRVISDFLGCSQIFPNLPVGSQILLAFIHEGTSYFHSFHQ